MAKRSKKSTCRWWDGYMDCCRNLETHPCVFKLGGMTVRTEPDCHPSKNCGYCKADADHPMWNADNDEFSIQH